MSSIPKYRPVLSAPLIHHITALAKKDMLASDSLSLNRSAELIALLSPFIAKIENAGITAAYTTKPTKPSLEESLGIEVGTVARTPQYTLDGVTYQSKEAYWEACYIKAQELGAEGAAKLSLGEIQAVQEHKYLNSLMSPEEKFAFEKEAFGL